MADEKKTAEQIQQERLDRMLDAEAKTLISQRYRVDNRENERPDLGSLGKGINDLIAGGAGGVNRSSKAKRVVLRE